VSERRVYTVAELTRLVKQTLEDEVGRVWVEGEISNLRRQSSGHCYFTLKDDRAQLSAVLFAGAQRGGASAPADGLRVRAFGDISVYEPRGQYQMIVRQIEPAGAGALMAQFEALKRRLQAEGLFDPARKRPLPLLPRHVGMVTSPTGAAIRDMLNVTTRRFANLHITLAPARVQGAGAAEEIAAAIDLLNSLPNPPEVLIVGRGGGSIEDLWPFNEECVARAIVRSGIPVISAVGHEIDFTISDFAADLRAPTPSAAAELVVGRKEDFEKTLQSLARSLRQALSRQCAEAAGRLRTVRASAALRDPRRGAERAGQQLDALEMRLRRAVVGALNLNRRRCEQVRAHLLMLRGSRLQQVRMRLDRQAGRMEHAARLAIERPRRRLESMGRTLQALSPVAVLERGYSLTRTVDGQLVRSVRQVSAGIRLRTRVADGDFESNVTEGG
jgi:exodeoxyribonuclease VII large subunit